MRDKINGAHRVGNVTVVVTQLVHRLCQILRHISKYFYFMDFPIPFESSSIQIWQLESCNGNQLLKCEESISWKFDVDTRNVNDELDPVDHSPNLGQARSHKGFQNCGAYSCCDNCGLRWSSDGFHSLSGSPVYDLASAWNASFAHSDARVEGSEVCRDYQ